MDDGIAGVEVQRAPPSLAVERPAAALRIDRGVDVELSAPWARRALQCVECRKRTVVSLHAEAHHQLVRLLRGLRLHQCGDQPVPYIGGRVIVERRRPEGTRRQCCTRNRGGDAVLTAEQIPEIIGHIVDLRDDLLLLCRDLRGRPCRSGTPLCRCPAPPAQPLVAELCAAVGALVG